MTRASDASNWAKLWMSFWKLVRKKKYTFTYLKLFLYALEKEQRFKPKNIVNTVFAFKITYKGKPWPQNYQSAGLIHNIYDCTEHNFTQLCPFITPMPRGCVPSCTPRSCQQFRKKASLWFRSQAALHRHGHPARERCPKTSQCAPIKRHIPTCTAAVNPPTPVPAWKNALARLHTWITRWWNNWKAVLVEQLAINLCIR